MTDDIVTRLREGAEYEHDTATMADAADEIVRLRGELETISNNECRPLPWTLCAPVEPALAGEKTDD